MASVLLRNRRHCCVRVLLVRGDVVGHRLLYCVTRDSPIVMTSLRMSRTYLRNSSTYVPQGLRLILCKPHCSSDTSRKIRTTFQSQKVFRILGNINLVQLELRRGESRNGSCDGAGWRRGSLADCPLH